jgi:hypothetical protein
MGSPFLEIFGPATADCNKPEAVGVLVAVGVALTFDVGELVGMDVGVPLGSLTLKSDTKAAAIGPLPGVQVDRGLQDGGVPPEAVTRFPW